MTMRRVAVLIGVLASLATGTAYADAGKLGGMGANLFGNSFFHFGQVNLKGFPVSAISAGRVHIELQHTKLADVQRAYGGRIYEEGQGMGIARWLCYEAPDTTTWFMSNALGGGDFIMMVATQAGPASGNCDQAPAGFTPPNMGIPSLGASTAELRAKFGSANTGSHSDVSYRSDRPARDGLGTASDAQYIGYVVHGGQVVGVGVGETTTTMN
jgi:hypothetical protein